MFGLIYAYYLLAGHYYLADTVSIFMPSCMQMYLIDYSVGFVSRAFIGSILSLFYTQISFYHVVRLCRVFVWLTFVLQAVFSGIVFRKGWFTKHYLFCALALLFCFNPVLVMANVIYLGLLDLFNLFLLMLFFLIPKARLGIVAAPVVCVVGIMIHYQFAVVFLPTVLLFQLYLIFREKKYRKSRTVSFAITLVLSVAATVYFVFFSKYSMQMNTDELYAYLCGKYKDYKTFGLFRDYYDYYVFGNYKGESYESPLAFVLFLINYSLERIEWKSLTYISLVSAPLLALFFCCGTYMFRHAEKQRRLLFLLLCLHPFLYVVALLLSTDILRWAFQVLETEFLLYFTMLRCNEPLLEDLKQRFAQILRSKRNRIAAAAALAGYLVYCIAYAYI